MIGIERMVTQSLQSNRLSQPLRRLFKQRKEEASLAADAIHKRLLIQCTYVSSTENHLQDMTSIARVPAFPHHTQARKGNPSYCKFAWTFLNRHSGRESGCCEYMQVTQNSSEGNRVIDRCIMCVVCSVGTPRWY